MQVDALIYIKQPRLVTDGFEQALMGNRLGMGTRARSGNRLGQEANGSAARRPAGWGTALRAPA
ncbi:hypothetical protein M758_UG083800 [Ceratodon purpureus]|nr:hypothetical protein M758_UG083800 [Ceratodon purpureus]